MSFGTRLKESRENKGYKQNQFAEMLGVTATRLNYWEKDKREPDVAMIKKISYILDVSSDWLIGNDEHIENDNFVFSNSEKQIIKKYRSLDIHGQKAVNSIMNIEYERCNLVDKRKIIQLHKSVLKASAGTGNWLEDEQLETVSVIATQEAYKANLVIEVDGDSMEPIYQNGDVVLVHTQETVEIGDIGIFILDGNGYIKRFAKDRLISLNPDYEDIYPNSDSDCRCVGKVLGKAEIVE